MQRGAAGRTRCPQYDKPYCFKCRGHTDYKVMTHTQRSEGGTRTYTTTKNVCRGCGKNMKAPREYDFAYYGPWGFGCLLFSCLLAIGCFLYVLFEGRGIVSSDFTHYLLIGTVSVVMIIGPVVLGIVAAKKYTTWKKWAEERGWKEPPRKERAWEKGDS